MKIEYFYKCFKFYFFSKLWELHYNTLTRFFDFVEGEILDPMYKDKKLEKFRNWYWEGEYKTDKAILKKQR